jgi:hypothetical protein
MSNPPYKCIWPRDILALFENNIIYRALYYIIINTYICFYSIYVIYESGINYTLL